MNYQRILVIGSPGAGKTTFSKRLAQETGLPLYHMDHLFWMPGWVERDRAEYENALDSVLQKDCWIIDGNHLRTMPTRLKRADKVYYLNVSRWRCTYRIIKRWLFREGFQAEGCPQKVDWEFLKFVFWVFPNRDKQRVEALLNDYKDKLDIERLT